jgi:hypothetical protein
MTARADLRETAELLDIVARTNVWLTQTFGPKEARDRAAALRALADRIDHEENTARQQRTMRDLNLQRDAGTVLSCLARLDASPLVPPACDWSGYVYNEVTQNGQRRCPGCPRCVPPREPTCKTCGGTRTEIIDGAAIGPCPDCAASPEVSR